MKSKGFAVNPIEALRRADPLDPREALTDPSGSHARALFQEVTGMDAIEKAPTPQRRQPLLRRVALAAAGVAVVATAAGGAYGLFRGDTEAAIVGGEPIGSGDPMAMCIQYTDETLAGQEFAFDGTLVSASAEGGEAVFEVHRWFKGGEGPEVTLSAAGLIGGDSLALVGASLEAGQRYLVSGTEGFVWACGYTLTYDTALAEHWAELFGA